MPPLTKLFALAAAGMVLSLAGPAQSEVLDAVGRIRSVTLDPARAQPRATLERPGVGPYDAAPRLLLYPGDTLRVTAGGRLEARVRGEPVNLGPAASAYKVPEHGSILFAVLDDRYMQNFLWLLTREKPGPNRFPVGRDQNSPPSAPITADPLLPAGVQRLPRDATTAVFLWRGGRATVSASAPAGTTKADSFGFSFSRITLPAGAAIANVEATGDVARLNWTVVRDDTVPRPTWQSNAAATTEERLVRAVWLLRDGPTDWHLFALTELAQLSHDNFVADELWTAVITQSFEAT